MLSSYSKIKDKILRGEGINRKRKLILVLIFIYYMIRRLIYINLHTAELNDY